MLARASKALAFVTALLLAPSYVIAQSPASPAKAKSSTPAVPAFSAGLQSGAQPEGGPDMTSETYGDWIIRCHQIDSVKRCEMSQTLILQGQTAPIALIAFGREKKGDPLRMVIQLPTNITFEGGVKSTLANGEPVIDMTFRRCFPSGCFADTTVTDAQINKLKAHADPLNIKFKDGTEREIALPLSLRGFGPALDALLRS